MLIRLRRILMKWRTPPPEPVNPHLNEALLERRVLLDRKDQVLVSFRKAQSTLKGRKSP